MNSRVLLLIGALLASSAQAQDPGFDLNSDPIKKIVHDSAASQSQAVRVQVADTKPTEPELVFDIDYVTPVAAPPSKSKIKPPRFVMVPQSGGLLSAVIETVVDEALGVDDEKAAVVKAATKTPAKP